MTFTEKGSSTPQTDSVVYWNSIATFDDYWTMTTGPGEASLETTWQLTEIKLEVWGKCAPSDPHPTPGWQSSEKKVERMNNFDFEVW
jgi:hypothetical protein